MADKAERTTFDAETDLESIAGREISILWWVQKNSMPAEQHYIFMLIHWLLLFDETRLVCWIVKASVYFWTFGFSSKFYLFAAVF